LKAFRGMVLITISYQGCYAVIFQDSSFKRLQVCWCQIRTQSIKCTNCCHRNNFHRQYTSLSSILITYSLWEVTFKNRRWTFCNCSKLLSKRTWKTSNNIPNLLFLFWPKPYSPSWKEKECLLRGRLLFFLSLRKT